LTGWIAPLAGLSATLALAWVWSRKPAGDEPRPRPFSMPPSWIAAIAAFGIAVLISHLALEGLPHVPDEVAYRFDAAVFAQGRRFGTSPPLPAAFPPPDWIEVERDRAYGVFPIGWPLLLAAGVRLGVPWLVNPLLLGGLVILIARLAARVQPWRMDPVEGRSSDRSSHPERGFFGPPLAALLAATSPFLLVLGASGMAHPMAMLLATVALLALLALDPADDGQSKTIGPGRALWISWLAAGSALLVLTRPIEGVALGLAAFVDAVFEARRRQRPARWRTGLLVLWGGLAIGALFLAADQARVTGNPLLPPVTQYFERHLGGATRNRLGFGPDVGLDWDGSPAGHTPIEALGNFWRNGHGLEREVLGWPAGSLLLCLVGLFAGRWNRGERLLIRHGASVIGLYALYWYHGSAYGPRFLSALVPGLVVFTVRGAAIAARALAGPGGDPSAARRWVHTAIAISIAASLVLHLPLVARYELRGLRGVRGAIYQTIVSGPTPGLYFVEGPTWPDYASLYFMNAPDFHGPRVIAMARGAELDSAVTKLYPGREVTRVSGGRPR
jgi:hypothetical protein